MDDVLQWAITTIVGILGIIGGRIWQKYDRRVEKDKITLDLLHKCAIIGTWNTKQSDN